VGSFIFFAIWKIYKTTCLFAQAYNSLIMESGIEDWWVPFQIELVKDDSIIWVKQRFTSGPGFWIKVDGGKLLGKVSENKPIPPDASIDNDAWDHEHCELCWEKISSYEGDQEEGYTNGKEWLCVACYDKYIVPRRKHS
jgi:hypothetical protein